VSRAALASAPVAPSAAASHAGSASPAAGVNATAATAATSASQPASTAQGSPDQEASSAFSVGGTDYTQLRDPFKQPELRSTESLTVTPLQRYRVEELRMIAVISGMRRTRAMVAAGDGKTFVIGKGTPIGIRGGQVVDVSPERVLVRERVVNVLGREENLDTELKLQPEGSGAGASANASGATAGGG
jgi:type IV pilus assembly protein PilP